jgi:tetratricopeptide (TPR) repeat protein
MIACALVTRLLYVLKGLPMNVKMIHASRLTLLTIGILCALAVRVQSQSAGTTVGCTDKTQDPPGESERHAMAADVRGDTRSALALMNQVARDVGSRGKVINTALVESELGDLYLEHGDFNRAFQQKKKAFQMYLNEGVLIEARRSAVSLATVLLHRDDANGADRYLAVARALAVESSCLDDDDRAAFASVSAWDDQLLGARDLAVQASATALDLWRKAHGEDHPFVGWGHLLLGDALANADEPTRALNEFRQATEILAKSLPSTDRRYQAAVHEYARALRKAGRKGDADGVLKDSLLH